jgi:hypothetical protein
MGSDAFISWLIHSDWYLVGGWMLVLAIAVVVTFPDVPGTLFRSRESGDVPPEP